MSIAPLNLPLTSRRYGYIMVEGGAGSRFERLRRLERGKDIFLPVNCTEVTLAGFVRNCWKA